MRFQKGQSGNPGGRPKGLAASIRTKCGHDGQKLMTGFWLIAFGTPKQCKAHFGEPLRVSTKDRLVAMSELADRGFGRAPQTHEVSGPEGGPVPTTVIHEHYP